MASETTPDPAYPEEWTKPLVLQQLDSEGGIVAELIVSPGTRVTIATDGLIVEQLGMPTPPSEPQPSSAVTGVVLAENPDAIRSALVQVNQSLVNQIEKGRNKT